jgi:hypothetical protein
MVHSLWVSACRFENELNISTTSGGGEGGNCDKEQPSKRYHGPDTSDDIAAAKGVLVRLSAGPVDGTDDNTCNGSDVDADVVSGSCHVMNYRAQEVFLELEKIKGVIIAGARSSLSPTMEAPTGTSTDVDRSFHNDSNDEMKSIIPDTVENNGHDATSGGVDSGDDSSLSLEKENVCLREVIKQRDMDLAQARAEIKALTTRATGAEHSNMHCKRREETMQMLVC